MTNTTELISTVLDVNLTGDMSGHIAPGSHVWCQQAGSVAVDGETWRGYMFFFASKEAAIEQGRSINAMGEKYQFSIDRGLHKRSGEDWDFTMVMFASPFDNLTIASSKGDADVLPAIS